MTSPAQQTASRTNGAQSKGPTTAEGKAKSAANSRKHGLCSKEFVLETPDEQARFAELERETRFTYQAKNPLEEEACHHLAVAIWRRRVCDNLEKDLLLAIQNGTACAQNGGDGLPGLNAVNRYRARIARDLREAREEINQLRAARVKAFADQMNKAKEMTDKKRHEMADPRHRHASVRTVPRIGDERTRDGKNVNEYNGFRQNRNPETRQTQGAETSEKSHPQQPQITSGVAPPKPPLFFLFSASCRRQSRRLSPGLRAAIGEKERKTRVRAAQARLSNLSLPQVSAPR